MALDTKQLIQPIRDTKRLVEPIPTKSKFGFHIDFELDNRANESGIISIEYWGKTTPYKAVHYNLGNLLESS